MENSLKNLSKQTILIITISLFISGIALAYFTNDTEPWGTIGGFMAGISLFGLILYATK